MSLFKIFRSAGQRGASSPVLDATTSEQHALRLIDEGNAIEDKGRPEEALQRYEAAIRLAPNLTRAHINRGNVLLATGDIEGAQEAFATAISKDHGYAPAHYNLGLAHARAGRHRDACAAFESAISLKPDFADAEVALACSLEELGEPAAAVACYRRALSINPGRAEVHCNLALVLGSLGQLEGSAESYRRAVELKPDFAAAHYSLGKTLQKLGRPDEAIASYRRALQIEPDIAVAHAELAGAMLRLGWVDEAVASYRRALKIDPAEAGFHCNLGDALMQRGQTQEAVASYLRAVEIRPDFAAAHCNLGNALLELGRADEAVASYRRAIEIQPDFAAAWVNLGIALRKLGRPEEAAASLGKALELEPDSALAHTNLGAVRKDLGQLDAAVASQRRAVEIQPDLAAAHCNLGDALRDIGQFDDAVASCRRALEIDPDSSAAYNNLGSALADLGRVDEAESSFRRALELEPQSELLHFNLAQLLFKHRSLTGAVASYRRALELKPDYLEAHNNLGNALLGLGQMDAAADCYRRTLELQPELAHTHSNLLFCLSHQEAIGPQALFAAHRGFGERFEMPVRASWPRHENARDPERRLQIGFVSADLRDHALACFIEPLWMHIAGSAGLSLHAYYSHGTEDSVTARLRRYVKHWHPIFGMSNEALAQKIADDGIDILIDLSGHTGEHRLLTFARKPAPVQASWMGYPGTTGLKAMDYYLADRHFLPPGEFDSLFTEKLVYLPASAPFMPGEAAPTVNALPALRNGFMTFGSFNRISKLSPSAIAVWAQLLRALPDSRLLLGGMPPDREYDGLIDRFAQEGIASDRLRPRPRCDNATYLALHHEVDMCLDAFPYTGGTTTNYALWMGVPTLTLAGPTPPGRQGAAVMGGVGLEAFVAKDAASFVRIGLSWAGDPGALADIRSGLRARLQRSAMHRPEVIAAGLESALRTMWRRWCAGLPPESFVAGVPATNSEPE